MRSCLYRGKVRHRRFSPRSHSFGYRLFMVYLDLDELDEVFAGRWLWSTRRLALARYKREDFLGDPQVPLKEAVHDAVEEQLGRRPQGAVRMLTNLRYLGYSFNPVTFYYCYDAADRLDAVVAEITNTPWNERHRYVLDAASAQGTRRWRMRKAFHISPFMDMDQDYAWSLNEPDDALAVHMRNERDGELLFDASLSLRRHPITGWQLAKSLLLHPFMTGKVIAGIYLQAAVMGIKRFPFHAHPRTRAAKLLSGERS